MVKLGQSLLLLTLSLVWAAIAMGQELAANSEPVDGPASVRTEIARNTALPPAAASSGPRSPIDVEDDFLRLAGAQAHFESTNKASEKANLAVAQNRVLSVPHFNSSFAFQSRTFPYTVVGGNPKNGQTTTIPTQVIPIALFFEGYADENGNPIVLDITPILSTVMNSPSFRPAQYPTGYTQFGDAVQRAQFFHAMSPEWHTMLGTPAVLRTVNIEVPSGFATLYRMRSSGTIFAVVDEGFFISQLNTILQFEDMEITGLPLALTRNVFLAPKSEMRQCCLMGFHTSFDAGERSGLQMIQTFVWASWIGSGIFGGTVSDVTAISHEISEWFNDPFNTNIVPDWQFPTPPAGCQNNLETGDPVSASPHAGYPVTIENFTYHPQNETLLQWFQRKTPSDAIDRAYSFPDETLLTSPAQPCTPN